MSELVFIRHGQASFGQGITISFPNWERNRHCWQRSI
jgi:hypothetical protein